ncbi:hypothetical protein THTE_2595 [Thermogutta terrifontis]|uniref:Uncharacterized protein n=1 Tax=Thermogutta terrifontis TaxID=1331910 RepID=A0A286RGW8_9BACT|nr:hypothetical protein [Thermogutta terrifontis]ASV75197.1 hypothetical protein THTE_2595 [Thermogutta terrifontis]
MNFFAWIREGVRQAVLLGVADAVDSLGTSPDGGDYRQKIGEVLRASPDAGQWKRLAGPQGGSRRKLGRGLEEIQASINTPAVGQK